MASVLVAAIAYNKHSANHQSEEGSLVVSREVVAEQEACEMTLIVDWGIVHTQRMPPVLQRCLLVSSPSASTLVCLTPALPFPQPRLLAVHHICM